MKTNDHGRGWSVDRCFRSMARLAARAGGYAVLTIAIMVSVDVILRKLFSVTLRGASELSGFLFAFCAAWAFGFAALEGAHVRVDVIYRLLPAPARVILNIVAILGLSATSALITWHGSALLLEALDLESKSFLLRLPLWIPQFFFSAGLFVFFLSNLFLLIRIVMLAWSRDYGQVENMAGVKQVDQ